MFFVYSSTAVPPTPGARATVHRCSDCRSKICAIGIYQMHGGNKPPKLSNGHFGVRRGRNLFRSARAKLVNNNVSSEPSSLPALAMSWTALDRSRWRNSQVRSFHFPPFVPGEEPSGSSVSATGSTGGKEGSERDNRSAAPVLGLPPPPPIVWPSPMFTRDMQVCLKELAGACLLRLLFIAEEGRYAAFIAMKPSDARTDAKAPAPYGVCLS